MATPRRPDDTAPDVRLPAPDGEAATLTSIDRAAHRGIQPLCVSVVRGPDAPRSVALPARPFVVGTSPACDLVLTDRTVSRRHVELHTSMGDASVRDLGSHNGTLVRGVRVIEAVVSSGVEIVVGDTHLAVGPSEGGAAPEASPLDHFGRVWGASLAMRQLYPLLERLAASEVTVLLEGETGTGKEVVAEALHEQGSRKEGPFVVFDCASVPATLMEAELFGHERGAFTGAVSTRKGLMEMARGGTLFIDELGELDPALQPKLLRAIERREYRRVGASTVSKADVRILAATRRDLDREVQAGRFRDDLFHRFAVARVLLPPLRLRTGDIAVLARRFYAEMAGETRGNLAADVLERLEDQPWPGNVRELRNAVLRYAALGSLDAGTKKSMRPTSADVASGSNADAVEDAVAQGVPYTIARDHVLQAFDRRYVTAMLARHGGNVSHAAAAAGVARRYFQTIKSRGGG